MPQTKTAWDNAEGEVAVVSDPRQNWTSSKDVSYEESVGPMSDI